MLEDAVRAGTVRAIGLCNFSLDELDEAMALAQHIAPSVIQDHVSPLASDRERQAWARAHGVTLMAYSLLGTQFDASAGNPVLSSPVLRALARKRGQSVPQLVLQWAHQLGMVVIPRTANATHLSENLHAFDAGPLSQDELAAIAVLDGTVVYV